MKLRALVFCLAMVAVPQAQSTQSSSASDLLHSALAAMGGEQQIRDLKTLHLTMMGHRNFLEQSERPEGPYIVEYEEIDEWRDLEHDRWQQEVHNRDVLEESSAKMIVADGAAAQKVGDKEFTGSDELLQTASDALAFGPERVLLNGITATDLKQLPDLKLQDVPHQVVQFTSAGIPVRVFLNGETHLPTAVEWVSAYPYGIFWSIWGDVTTRVYYSLWWLQNGIHYPLQLDVFRNNLPDRSATVRKIEFNAQVPPETFAITPAVRSAFAAHSRITADERPLQIASRPVQEPAPGIVIIPGAWNATIVRQQDGLVVLEAPISSGYSAKIIAEAERRFPGVPIRAVITTSDAWPHIGGVREYVARKIPVYVIARTVPLLQRFLEAPRTILPDTLAKSPRKPLLHTVSDRLSIGSGPNRIEIYPLRGETSERQMMIYFPEHKLLYGSDVFQKTPDGKYFYPQTVSEVAAAVAREHLSVERFFMMHMGVTPWQDALDVLRDAS